MIGMLASGFLLACLAPTLTRVFPQTIGRLIALLPLGLFLWCLSVVPSVLVAPLRQEVAWAPQLGLTFSFQLDGLSLLMALLITGLGALVMLYAGRYLQGHRDLGRFYALLLSFMAAMLGLVLADNVFVLFIFWELTSITSFLLIGFAHQEATARQAARQGLLVTAGGGLVLLAGLIVLTQMGGSTELSVLMTRGDVLRAHEDYGLALTLILIGAFTKSAQFPFHFWLPNAMAAPTPVSAYLHSATMVKAGIYLLYRCHPGLGGTEAWQSILPLVGSITAVWAMVLACRAAQMKAMLAYSTVVALGLLTLLIGIGTPAALTAAAVLLLAHALYKGALFLIAGVVDHETGHRTLARMGGWRRRMPLTTLIAALAAASLAGVLPLLGFLAKELMLDAALQAAWGVLPALMIVAIGSVVLALNIGWRPWAGPEQPLIDGAPGHDPGPDLLFGPALLATLGLLLGLLPDQLSPLMTQVVGVPVTLIGWHGLNLPLLLSTLSLVAGVAVYRRLLTTSFTLPTGYGPEAGFDGLLARLLIGAQLVTQTLQSGYLRRYLLIILFSLMALVGSVLWGSSLWAAFEVSALLTPLAWHEPLIIAVLVLATLMAARATSRLAALAALGVLGFMVMLLYVLFSAPDVAITQVLVETLTVILLVLALHRLPPYLALSPRWARWRDIGVASLVGSMMTLLILITQQTRFYDSLAPWFIERSVSEGYGRNVVNVILVDFRAFDTLGEIAVLSLAALGVMAMIRFRYEDR